LSSAISMLRQATNILVDNISNINADTTSQSPSPVHVSLHATPAPARSQVQGYGSFGSGLSEFRNLFSRYSSNQSQRTPGPARSQRTTARRGEKRWTPYKVRETWTHEFVCLGCPDATSVPNKSEKIKLQNAGLGRRKICFGCSDSAKVLQDKLEKEYPKLRSGGGFELMRSGMHNSLMVIIPPMGGYSVPFLRDQAGLGQALAYIRPMQKGLDMSDVVADVVIKLN